MTWAECMVWVRNKSLLFLDTEILELLWQYNLSPPTDTVPQELEHSSNGNRIEKALGKYWVT